MAASSSKEEPLPSCPLSPVFPLLNPKLHVSDIFDIPLETTPAQGGGSVPKPHRWGPKRGRHASSVPSHEASPPVSHPIIPPSTVGLNADAISFVSPTKMSVCAVSHGQASGTCISAAAGTSDSKVNPWHGYPARFLFHPKSCLSSGFCRLEGEVLLITLISSRTTRGGKAGKFTLVSCQR